MLGDACEPRMLDEAHLAAPTSSSPLPAMTRTTWSRRCWRSRSSPFRGVLARVNHPTNEWLFTDQWGVDTPSRRPTC